MQLSEEFGPDFGGPRKMTILEFEESRTRKWLSMSLCFWWCSYVFVLCFLFFYFFKSFLWCRGWGGLTPVRVGLGIEESVKRGKGPGPKRVFSPNEPCFRVARFICSIAPLVRFSWNCLSFVLWSALFLHHGVRTNFHLWALGAQTKTPQGLLRLPWDSGVMTCLPWEWPICHDPWHFD